MRYRLATEYYDDIDTGLASNPYVIDHISGIWGKIRDNQRAFQVDQLNWRNRAQQQKQDYDWQEKFQKMNNRYAQLQSDVGKNNKWHSLAQGAIGLGASFGANALANTSDIGNAAVDAQRSIFDMNAIHNGGLETVIDGGEIVSTRALDPMQTFKNTGDFTGFFRR